MDERGAGILSYQIDIWWVPCEKICYRMDNSYPCSHGIFAWKFEIDKNHTDRSRGLSRPVYRRRIV